MTVRTGGTCTIEGCEKPMFGRTWCGMHYATWRKYGDPCHPVERRMRGLTCLVEGCDKKANGRGMCSVHRRRVLKHGEATDPRTRRFWANVDTRGPDECWPWVGYVQPNGYGSFSSHERGTTRLAHRIAYEYMVGSIPAGLMLDHVCHTRDPRCEDRDSCPHRRCCNPAHLEPVTARENLARGRSGDSWGYIPAQIPRRAPEPKPIACTEVDAGVPCSNPIYKRTTCRKHYRRWLRDKSVERPSQRTPEQRFWAKVNKRGTLPDGRPDLGQCWLWTGTIHGGTGYGNFYPKHGQTVGAHRYSYELAKGPIPEGFEVHHECWVRACVNPAHLTATDRATNVAQRRNRRADRT